ncbi:MAG: alpha/beta fold hydrolase [Patescibacteria group bacterium]
MRPAHVIEITTPKNFVLNGLWFGSEKPKRAIILVHGLTGSAFSGSGIVDALADDDTAVITFNNRGHDIISNLKQRVGAETKYSLGGAAHEVFIDCLDDIEGAIRRVRQEGIKDVYLAGHSTGAQKIAYYTSKTGGKKIKGLILLGALSDYASERKKPKLRSAAALAKRMVKAGKSKELLPLSAWWQYLDAQRFLSLYTPDSVEEIFMYSQPDKKPKIYQSVKIPMIAFFAGEDEYADRPAEKIAEWFTKHSKSSRFATHIISGVGHSLKDVEEQTARLIRKWL